MYSVVLMTALMSTTTAPGFGRCNCGYATAYAGPYHWGYAVPTHCHSCYASPVWGYGAAGGCYGYHGGCYGGWGVSHDPYAGCTGCYGCYGGYAGYGIPVPPINFAPQGAPKDPYPAINPKKEKQADKPKEEEVAPPKEKKKGGLEEGNNREPQRPMRATVRIEVPQGGKLFVDGRRINVPAGTRAFQTPALAPGETYFYDIRIEVDRDGAIAADERRVVIRPGQDVAVDFPTLRARGNATARARP